VSVTFESRGFAPGFAERVLSDLNAGLDSRGIDACAAGSGRSSAPLASVNIAGSAGRNVAVLLEIRDAVTEKRVLRDVDLSRVPADGRAFAVAIAVDELVWASWAEIALAKRDRTEPPTRAPPEVVRGVERALPEREQPSWRVGAHTALERFAGGQTQLGADVGASFRLSELLGLGLSAGLRQGRAVPAENGRVISSAAGFESVLSLTILRAVPFELALFAGPRAALVRFTGRPVPEARGGELTGLVVYLRGGAAFGVRLLGPLFFDVAGGVGAPLRALEATDAGEVVTGASGLELSLRAGLMVEL
jgi:hypothetical protein